MNNVIDRELASAVEEAFMARDTTTPSTLGDIQDQWNEHLIAGNTPVQAATSILEAHAAAIGASASTDATDFADLVEGLIADAFSNPDSWPVLERITWLWQAGHTSGRPDDEPAVYVVLALLLVADRGGADVQDLLERVRRQLATDELAEA